MDPLQLFHHQIAGNPSGHKLVFLHGLMGSGANWRRITPAFEAEFKILTYDQRGHGKSFKPESGYAPSDFAGDLDLLTSALGWQKFSLVGHSMGGRNALEFAHRHPQKLEKLVIEDIGPGAAKATQGVIERLLTLVPTPFVNRSEAKTFFEQEYEGRIAFHPQPRVIRQFLQSNLTDREDGSVDWRFSKSGVLEALRAGHAQTRWDMIDALRIPTLWLRGEISTDLPRLDFDEIRRRNPLIRGVEIPGAGHWIHFDQPDAFVAVVKEFLTLPG